MSRAATKKRRPGTPPEPPPIPKSMPEASHANTHCGMPEMTCTSMPPETILWGKLNHGQTYGIKAWDIDRAIRLARLSPNQNILLGEYIEECWGEAIRIQGKKRDGQWPDALGSRINLAELARQLKMTPQQLSKAKRELIASKILVEGDDEVIRINKQADEWVHHKTGEPRLSPDDILYCRRAQPNPPAVSQSQFGFTRERVNPRAPHRMTVASSPAEFDAPHRQPCAPRVANDVPTPTPTMIAPIASLVPPTSQTMSPSPAPIEERPRGVEL